MEFLNFTIFYLTSVHMKISFMTYRETCIPKEVKTLCLLILSKLMISWISHYEISYRFRDFRIFTYFSGCNLFPFHYKT